MMAICEHFTIKFFEFYYLLSKFRSFYTYNIVQIFIITYAINTTIITQDFFALISTHQKKKHSRKT